VTPPARPPRTRLPPEQRRQQLLHCAIAAAAEHGVARLTHAHVAERAGVSVSAVHSYFRTRDDLVAATLAEVEAYLMAWVASVAGQPGSARQALSDLVDRFDAEAREAPDPVKVWLDWSTGFRADVWPRYLLMQDRLIAAIEKLFLRGRKAGEFGRGLNARAAARLYVGGGITVALMRFAGAGEREIRTVIGHLLAGFSGADAN
jgi:TetR/AcrR family transcriptional regulator, hemagglutinin/protease regulatory protein